MVGGAGRIFIAGRLCLLSEDSGFSRIHVLVMSQRWVAETSRDKSR